MLLRWLAGGLSALPGPSPYTRDILLRLPTYTIERERGIPIGQAMPERGMTSRPLSFPNVACVQSLGLIYCLISDYLFITIIKTAVDKQLFLRRHTRSLELKSGHQWWRVGTFGRGQQCRLGYYPNARRDIVQRCRDADVPLRTRAQDAAFGA